MDPQNVQSSSPPEPLTVNPQNYGKDGSSTNVLGFASLVAAFIFPPLGLILGIIALQQAKKQQKSKVLAGVAITISALAILALPLLILLLIIRGGAIA